MPTSTSSSSRIVLVTGASSGIGHAIALRLARDGYTVFAGVRRPDALQTAPNLHPIMLDVTSQASIDAALARVAEQPLYALINNAGICVASPLETVALSALREQLEVNVLGTTAMIQAALPALLATRGRIINIGSNVGRLTPPFLGPYAASKAALEALSDALRRELASFGVRVSLVVPGPVLTPVWDKIAASSRAHLHQLSEPARRRYQAPLTRFLAMNEESARRSRTRCDDVASLVAACLRVPSPKARYEIGLGASAGTWISRLVPTPWIDRAFRQVIKQSGAA
jgi:NAD(P)-dependent dehydrogenase (short-subunit alcohol dehydrogenase family)